MLGTWSEQGPGSVSAAPTSALPKSCCSVGFGWWGLGSGEPVPAWINPAHRFPKTSSGVTLTSGKAVKIMCKPGCVSLKQCGTSPGTSQDLQWNLESWNIITASLKLEKTSRIVESDLQNHWVQLLKLHRTFTGNSQDFYREFPQTFQAFSTPAKAGISPQWAPTQHHKQTPTILWPFLPL